MQGWQWALSAGLQVGKGQACPSVLRKDTGLGAGHITGHSMFHSTAVRGSVSLVLQTRRLRFGEVK